MPWLDDYRPKTLAARQWNLVFQNALAQRIPAALLEPVLKELRHKHAASPDEVAGVLLDFRSRDYNGTDDALLYHYVGLALRLGCTYTHHILLALLKTSRYTRQPSIEPKTIGLPFLEERIFFLLTQLHMTGEVSRSAVEAHELVLLLTRWMHVLTTYEMGKQLENGPLHTADEFACGMYENLASLVLTIFGMPSFKSVAKQTWWPKRRGFVVEQMESFDTHVLAWMHSALAGRMRAMATLPPFLETNDKGRPILNDQQILQSISDLPAVRTKAALFIWLNACLCARPLTDDMTMLSFLQARYSGEMQTLVVDLLIAGFDVLANFLLCKESEQSIKVVRSFLCNKVPSLLTLISSFMAPSITMETCIQMAFMTIPMDAVPPLSEGAVETRDTLKLARTEVLQASILHGLITEGGANSIVQEPITAPKNKYTKDSLLAQCNSNLSRLESLISEIETTVGNANAISGCIVDTLGNLCLSKETMSLKSVCNMLVKRISSLDIILQYTQPAALLLPVCNVLNEWVHDQDQAELTPSFEEFASILLFLYAAVHRYKLERADLGLQKPLPNDGNFVARLLQEKSVSVPLSTLTEEQNMQLGKWIEGLYGTDEQGEPSGISDDVMRHCPPQAFFSLVPTLFEQSLLACRSGALPMKTFKGGLELLVEPFLLPALIGGLGWLIKHAWEDHGDADVLLQILEKLLKPSSSSSDTKAMHQAVFAVIAKPMHSSLREMIKKKPSKEKQVKSLMEVLKPHLNSQRSIAPSANEVAEWTSPPNDGVSKLLRKVVDSNISWVSNVGPTPPPRYTHRLFAFAYKILGAAHVRDILVTAVKEHTKTGNGPLALDICTAMIAAPLPDSDAPMPSMVGALQPSTTAQQSVRDNLRLWVANPQTLLSLPEGNAEALVRLSRRVEIQLAVNQMPQLALPIPIQDEATDQIMADLGLTEHAGAAGGTLDQTGAGADFTGTDLGSALGGTIDLTGVSAEDLASGNANTDHDIFGDLDLGGLGGGSTGQQQQNPDGTATASGDGQTDMDDDIFAGLDMMGDVDDYNFS